MARLRRRHRGQAKGLRDPLGSPDGNKSRQPKAGPITQLESELLPVLDLYSQALDRYAQSFRSKMGSSSGELKEGNTRMLQLLAVLASVVAVLSCIFACRITRSISARLAVAETLANSVASGRLENFNVALGDAEAANLLLALEGMQTNLHSMVAQVRTHAG